MMKLAAAGGERSTRLAQRLAVAKSTLTATADGLVSARYASRATEPGHRRVVRLSQTPAGRAALVRADAEYCAWLGQLLDATGDPEAMLDALELLSDGDGGGEAGEAGTRPHATGDAGGPSSRACADGDGKERGHGHPTALQDEHADQRGGGG